MELKYIVLTIVKILISVPGLFLLFSMTTSLSTSVSAATVTGGDRKLSSPTTTMTTTTQSLLLMGGHLDNNKNNGNNNNSQSSNVDYLYYDDDADGNAHDYLDDNDNVANLTRFDAEPPGASAKTANGDIDRSIDDDDESTIPDPEKLVAAGYNLPETVFNRGQPFYLEKDPVTGDVDFVGQTTDNDDDAKENGDNGGDGGHKSRVDVNQLTPITIHDYLNLPVKYNPAKYVYPLISGSYANTKIQGNVVNRLDKFHDNHKDHQYYYYHYNNNNHNNHLEAVGNGDRTSSSTTRNHQQQQQQQQNNRSDDDNEKRFDGSTSRTTTIGNNLMDSVMMHHPSYQDDVGRRKTTAPVIATKPPTPPSAIATATKQSDGGQSASSSTKKPMSFLERLFFGGNDDDDVEAATAATTSTTTDYYSHNDGGVVQPEANYDYADDYAEYVTDNIAVEDKQVTVVAVTVPPTTITRTTTTTAATTVKASDQLAKKEKKPAPSPSSLEKRKEEKVAATVSKGGDRLSMDDSYFRKRPNDNDAPVATTMSNKPAKVTSLPLGDNHVTPSNNNNINSDGKSDGYDNAINNANDVHKFRAPSQPIIVTTKANLRERLNGEKVALTVQMAPPPMSPSVNNNKKNSAGMTMMMMAPSPPSTSNVRIAHDQDTVSFVVGNQQSVGGGEDDNDDDDIFRPMLPTNNANRIGSVVNVQANKMAETSLAIGRPIGGGGGGGVSNANDVVIGSDGDDDKRKVPGKVMDATLHATSSLSTIKGTRIVFPNDETDAVAATTIVTPVAVSTPAQTTTRTNGGDVLNLESQPTYHQLPPHHHLKQQQQQNNYNQYHQQQQQQEPLRGQPAMNRVRPPWDPRPGHFYAGRPEYAVRPPPRRPIHAPPSAGNNNNKRIDTALLPNILPQFRPNVVARVSASGTPPHVNSHHPHQHNHHHHHHPPPPLSHQHHPHPQHNHHHPFAAHKGNVGTKFARLPLLDRPSNNRLTMMTMMDELLRPPPVPTNVILDADYSKYNGHQQGASLYDATSSTIPPPSEGSDFYGSPPPLPPVLLNNRRTSPSLSPLSASMEDVADDDDDAETVATLQMIQAKKQHQQTSNDYAGSPPLATTTAPSAPATIVANGNRIDRPTDKPIYVVYPVNTSPSKLNANVNNNINNREIVVGTRADAATAPLPPTNVDDDHQLLLGNVDNRRVDAPILRPHVTATTTTPSTTTMDDRHQSDFPYRYERPPPPPSPQSPSGSFMANYNNNQWNSLDADYNKASRIVYGTKKTDADVISVTLKRAGDDDGADGAVVDDRPIAVAYTPTTIKYWLPPDAMANRNPTSAEFKVTATMSHDPNNNNHHQHHHKPSGIHDNVNDSDDVYFNTRRQDFEAPFQASVNLDQQINNHDDASVSASSSIVSSLSQGWRVIVRDNKTDEEAAATRRKDAESTTTIAVATTGHFDIENFKPQLIGGFKPLYGYPATDEQSKNEEDEERRRIINKETDDDDDEVGNNR